jgi:hypothetical protein
MKLVEIDVKKKCTPESELPSFDEVIQTQVTRNVINTLLRVPQTRGRSISFSFSVVGILIGSNTLIGLLVSEGAGVAASLVIIPLYILFFFYAESKLENKREKRHLRKILK